MTCVQIAGNENHEIGLYASDVVCLGFAEATNDAVPLSSHQSSRSPSVSVTASLSER